MTWNLLFYSEAVKIIKANKKNKQIVEMVPEQSIVQKYIKRLEIRNGHSRVYGMVRRHGVMHYEEGFDSPAHSFLQTKKVVQRQPCQYESQTFYSLADG